MLYNEPSPLEVKVLTRRFELPNSASIDTYLASDGYKAFMKAVGMTPDAIINEVKVSNLRGRGGAGFRIRLSREVAICASGRLTPAARGSARPGRRSGR